MHSLTTALKCYSKEKGKEKPVSIILYLTNQTKLKNTALQVCCEILNKFIVLEYCSFICN